MKRALIVGMIMLYAHLVNAQCGNMMSKAQNYYQSKDYANAKAQFQKVVDKCPTNAEIAQEYIILCNRWIALKEEERLGKEQIKSMLDENVRRIKELEQGNSCLQDKNTEYEGTMNKSAEKLAKQNSIINAKSDTIKMEREKMVTLYSSFRKIGTDLNKYLEDKLGKDRKKEIKIICDTTNNDSLVSFMRDNVRLVKEIKTSLF